MTEGQQALNAKRIREQTDERKNAKDMKERDGFVESGAEGESRYLRCTYCRDKRSNRSRDHSQK